MNTAILSTESDSDFRLIIELSRKLNLKTKILRENSEDISSYYFANESSLTEWLTPEENDAWKNL